MLPRISKKKWKLSCDINFQILGEKRYLKNVLYLKNNTKINVLNYRYQNLKKTTDFCKALFKFMTNVIRYYVIFFANEAAPH